MSIAIEIEDRLSLVREQLLEAIERIPDEGLLKPATAGRFSIVEMIAILTAWEAELITGMMRLNQDKKPVKLLEALANPDAFDTERSAESSGRDLDDIFDDFQHVRMQLETWLEEFSDKDLSNPKRYKWFGGKSLAAIIARTTYDNEAKYVPDLTAAAREYASGS